MEIGDREMWGREDERRERKKGCGKKYMGAISTHLSRENRAVMKAKK